MRFLLALPRISRNYVELGSCGKSLATRGCIGGLCGKRPGTASCQTHAAQAGSAMDCCKDTAEPINKAESPSLQMSLWKSRAHCTGRGRREKKETVRNVRKNTKLRGWKGCSSWWNENHPTEAPYLSPHCSRYFPDCTTTQRSPVLVCGNCVERKGKTERKCCLDPDPLHLLLPRWSCWL